MGTTGEGPLSQSARALQARSQQFQQELTEAAFQSSSDPAAALARLDRCWTEAGRLEQDELAFLAQMGEWGSQQVPRAKSSWMESRLQIALGKAQVLLILGRYDEAQSAIDSARLYIADPSHPAGAMLDQLEIAILQARG